MSGAQWANMQHMAVIECVLLVFVEGPQTGRQEHVILRRSRQSGAAKIGSVVFCFEGMEESAGSFNASFGIVVSTT